MHATIIKQQKAVTRFLECYTKLPQKCYNPASFITLKCNEITANRVP